VKTKVLPDPIKEALDDRRKVALSALRLFVDALDGLTEEERTSYTGDRTTHELEWCATMIFGRLERLLWRRNHVL